VPALGFGVRSLQNLPFGDVMKRIAAFMLLVVLSVAGAISAQAQRISPEENARQSRKAIKKQQKMLNKANKKQRKAMKKYGKKQQKATKKANKNLQRRRS
jgi:sensor domain CHASE-containing protein